MACIDCSVVYLFHAQLTQEENQQWSPSINHLLRKAVYAGPQDSSLPGESVVVYAVLMLKLRQRL